MSDVYHLHFIDLFLQAIHKLVIVSSQYIFAWYCNFYVMYKIAMPLVYYKSAEKVSYIPLFQKLGFQFYLQVIH